MHSILVSSVVLLSALPVSAQAEKVISGRVTDGKHPVARAIVRVQATTLTAVTDSAGLFTINNVGDRENLMVTAWKMGYYNGGTAIDDEMDALQIVLAPLPVKDNQNYEWIDPSPNPNDDIKNCGDCHASIIYDQWVNNGHARAASNPFFMSLYNGQDISGNITVQPGFKLDYPHSNGNCSNCHAPGAAVRNYTGVDMNEISDVEALGVSYDFCHKVRDVQMQPNTSLVTGVMHMDLLRPPDDHQMFFGPYDDVPNPDAYSPIISESIFCAPCHQGSFWGVDIYESYSEWLASAYAAQGVSCQDCHMTPDGITTNFAPGKGGVERDPLTIPTHKQFGSRDDAFLASSVDMQTTAAKTSGILEVTVKIKNIFAGHHLPTDQPMRNMILLVKTTDALGNKLKYLGDQKVPIWGGRGDPADGNYEGLPGKGFAKVLFEPNPLYNPNQASLKGRHVFPAPQWRLTLQQMTASHAI